MEFNLKRVFHLINLISFGWLHCPIVAQTIEPNTVRSDIEFEVFQFPKDQIPRIDGLTDDWDIYPEKNIYSTDLLKDTEDNTPYPVDTTDLKVKVKVGWVAGLNRLYFLYEAYDDYWDFGRFNPKGYLNDIFEIVVDGDLSGGPFIFNDMLKDAGRMGDAPAHINNHLRFSGVHAQNYHIYTPPVNNAWTLIWGIQPWIAEFPQANRDYQYDFQPGESGHLTLEFYITLYDHAPHSGVAQAQESQLRVGDYIGLSWSVLDFDGGKREGHNNLSHNTLMVKDASYLCAFQLMPLEERFQPKLQAEWSFEVIDLAKRLVYFKDESIGKVEKWTWDFGDGQQSNEASPVHKYKKPGVYYVVTLTVEDATDASRRTRYWEVMVP